MYLKTNFKSNFVMYPMNVQNTVKLAHHGDAILETLANAANSWTFIKQRASILGEKQKRRLQNGRKALINRIRKLVVPRLPLPGGRSGSKRDGQSPTRDPCF